MDIVLYEKPIHIELVGCNLFVEGKQHSKSVRLLGQMKKTLMRYTEGAANLEVYYMYRDVYNKNDMRFDITVIPAVEISGECAKTYGHYHPKSEDGLCYPEVYQVLEGSVVFILQKKQQDESVEVIIVHAKKGNTIILPPGYGHVSINNAEGDLVLANLVYDKFESVYDEYEDNKGAPYYYLKGGELAHNTNYIVRKTEQLSANELNRRYGFSCKDIITEFLAEPEKFAFLAKPRMMFKD